MARRPKPEEIVAKLRQVDVLVSAGTHGSGRGALDRRDGGHLLSVAQGVRRPEGRPGEAAEGSGDREPAAAEGGRRSDLGQADPQRGRPGNY